MCSVTQLRIEHETPEDGAFARTRVPRYDCGPYLQR